MRRVLLVRLLSGVAVLLLGLGLARFGAARAQGPLEWTEPVVISGWVPGSSFPVIAQDTAGGLYVLWLAEYLPFEDAPDVAGWIIYLTKGEDQHWTTPVDVLITPGTYSLAWQLSAVVDADGLLHVVWVNPNRALYHSSAHASAVVGANEWSVPRVLAEAAQVPYAVVDQSGNLHVLYLDTSADGGVYHISSSDHGATWSGPVLVSDSLVLDPGAAWMSEMIMAEFDQGGDLHAVWLYGGQVQYARSADAGRTWSQPSELDRVEPGDVNDYVSDASIAVDGQGGVHVIWNAGHDGRSCARYWRWSQDGGVTWSPRRVALQPMQGCLGWTNMVRDSDGTLHLVGIARDGSGVHRLWYAQWLGGDWSDPQSVTNVAVEHADWQDVGLDRPRVVVSEGNKLNVVWHTRDGQIWFSSSHLAAPSAVEPLPVPLSSPDPTPIPTLVEPTPEASGGEPGVDWQGGRPTSFLETTSSHPAYLGAGLASGVVGAALVIILLTRGGRRGRGL